MIKGIKVNGVHGVNKECKFEKQSRIVGQSKIGKTTMLNCIMAGYSGFFPGYGTSLPEGGVTINTDDGDIEIAGKRVVGQPILEESKAELIKYIIPGNFFKLTTGTPQQRLLITKVLGIDTAVLEDANENIKRLKLEERDFDSKKDQISDDAIRLEDELGEDPVKPEDVKPISDNSNEINERYNKYISNILESNRKILAENQLLKEDYERDLVNAEATHSGDISTLRKEIGINNTQLSEIQSKAAQTKEAKDYNCSSCGQIVKVDDQSAIVEKLRLDYKKYADSNIDLEHKLSGYESIRANAISQVKVPEYSMTIKTIECNTLAEKATYVGIPYKGGNNIEYAEYQQKLADYNQAIAKKDTIQKEIEVKNNQLKELNNTNLTKDIKRYEKIKTEFNKMVEEKVKETGLDIRLFKELKNGNIKDTFEIYDEEGFSYNATSSGNEIYMELLIAKLFVEYLELNFILVDKWESVGINLRSKILKEIGDLQLIATEVTRDKDIKVMKI